MSDYPFSIIVTTYRGIKELNPLFESYDKESELIITDHNYNKNTKELLKKYKNTYREIIYAPIINAPLKFPKSCIRGMNTALMYAENEWIIRADDNLEFKPNFFDLAREDIAVFKDALGHSDFGIVGSKLWGSLNQEKWNDYSEIPASRYIEVQNPAATFSFGVMPMEMIYNLNGYVELYDLGWGGEDTCFLHRGLVAGYKFHFDKELMGYSHAHQSNLDSFSINGMIYALQKLEINAGKIHAFNTYNIREMQNKMLAMKEDYIIK